MILTIILKIINEIPGCGENDWRFPKGIKGVKYKFDILLSCCNYFITSFQR